MSIRGSVQLRKHYEMPGANTATLLVVALYPFLPLLREWNASLGTVVELVAVLLLVAIVFVKAAKGEFSLSVVIAFALISLFLLMYCLVGCLAGAEVYEAVSGFRSIYLPFLVLLSLGSGGGWSRISRTMPKVVIFVALCMSIGCIVQFVLPDIVKSLHNPSAWDALRDKTDWIPLSEYNRALSFMNDPNILSVLLCSALFVVVDSVRGFHLVDKKLVLLIVVIVLGIILTRSRTGLILMAMYAILSFAFFLRSKKIKPVWIHALVIGAFLAMYFAMTFTDEIVSYMRVDTLLTGNGRFDNNVLHYELLSENLPVFLFGHGLFDGRSITFENSYLLCLYMFGIVGLSIFSILSFVLCRPFIGKNPVSVLCCGAALFVGDYILIPQISIYMLIWLMVPPSGRREGDGVDVLESCQRA